MNYAVYDVETTVRAPKSEGYSFSGDPTYPNNRAVMAGILDRGVITFTIGAVPTLNGQALVVGHNLGFDIQWNIRANQDSRPQLWDTAVAHYLMTAHQHKYPSLNEVAAYYGLGTKIDILSVAWDMGLQTEHVDPDVLREYLQRDLELTEQVYLKQMEAVADDPLLVEAIINTSTAQWFLSRATQNGLPVWQAGAETALRDKEQEMEEYSLICNSIIQRTFGIPDDLLELVNTTSANTIAAYLYGGTLTCERSEPTMRVLKNGKVSSQKRVKVYEFPCRRTAPLAIATKFTTTGKPATDEGTLQEFIHDPYIKALLDRRKAEKLASTYLRPMATARHGVHPRFNVTSTDTGRTSANGPNSQNLPPEALAVIRPPEGMYLFNADFKSLQMMGIAMLCGDRTLIDDINSGRDVHFESGKLVYGWKTPEEMDKATRRIVKNINFGLLFDGSDYGIAAQTGADRALVKKVRSAFFSRYPGVKTWHQTMREYVESEAQVLPGQFLEGYPLKDAYYRMPDGRIIRWVQKKTPDFIFEKTGDRLNFSPNEVVNYPVQGYTDGGLAIKFLALCKDCPGSPVNFVHDSLSIVTDNPKEIKEYLTEKLVQLNMTSRLEVPLTLEFEVIDSNGEKLENV